MSRRSRSRSGRSSAACSPSTRAGAGSSSSTCRWARWRWERRCSSSTSRATRRAISVLDVPGLVTSGVGLFALTYALIEANSYGWGSARIVGASGLAVVSLGAFVLLELRQRRTDARPDAVPQPDVLRGERGDAARRARDVRGLLLRLALRPAGPRLLAGRGGGPASCQRPCSSPGWRRRSAVSSTASARAG